MLKCLQRNQSLQFCLKRILSTSAVMANSRFDYVRDFETNDSILPNCWIVVRIDGKAFHKFTQKHDFIKPNDDNGKYTDHSIFNIQAIFKDFYRIRRFEFDELCSRPGDEGVQ